MKVWSLLRIWSVCIASFIACSTASADDGDTKFKILPKKISKMRKEAEIPPNVEGTRVSLFLDKRPDMDKSSSDFDYDFHRGYGRDFHNDLGHKGFGGYHDADSYNRLHHGDYGNHRDKDFFKKGGKDYRGYDINDVNYGGHLEGDHGSLGHDVGSKGYTGKGKENKGFKNLYHKEEYGVNKNFHDDDDFKKFHLNGEDYDSYFKSNHGGKTGGENYNGNNYLSFNDKHGLFDKGQFFDNHAGIKGGYGADKRFDHGLDYGNHGNLGFGRRGSSIGHGLGGLYDGHGYGGGLGLGGYSRGIGGLGGFHDIHGIGHGRGYGSGNGHGRGYGSGIGHARGIGGYGGLHGLGYGGSYDGHHGALHDRIGIGPGFGYGSGFGHHGSIGGYGLPFGGYGRRRGYHHSPHGYHGTPYLYAGDYSSQYL